MTKGRICVVTAGHLSTTPRMLKAADALDEAGWDVRVVSTSTTPWAAEADRALRATRRYPVRSIELSREVSRGAWLRAALRVRAARAAVRALGPERAPLGLAARAKKRAHDELVTAVLAEPFDLVYGGGGALAPAAEAARRAGRPYALDLEDFHSAESAPEEDALEDRLSARIERAVLGGARLLTTSSEPIAAAYRETYGVAPVVLHNVFPLPPRAPDLAPSPGPGLSLFWFSQTVGPGRGLEDAVRAMGRAEVLGTLHLLGRPDAGFLSRLRELARSEAPRLDVSVHEPVPPDAVVDAARPFDVGLALEPLVPRNRALCLTNKALTYLLAALPVAMTDTPGQRALGRDLGEGTFLFPPGDVDAFAKGLARWAGDRAALGRAKAAAWEGAVRRWRWDHPLEKGALVSAAEAALA